MEIEIGQLDLRYAGVRARQKRREGQVQGSVAQAGQQVPIVVVREDGRYVVVDGFKRVTAAQRLRQDTVSVIRVDDGRRPEAVAQSLGRSRGWLTARTRLQTLLPSEVQERVRRGEIDARVASGPLATLARTNRRASGRLGEAIAGKGVARREAQELVKAYQASAEPVRERLLRDPMLFLKARRQDEGAAEVLRRTRALLRAAGRLEEALTATGGGLSGKARHKVEKTLAIVAGVMDTPIGTRGETDDRQGQEVRDPAACEPRLWNPQGSSPAFFKALDLARMVAGSDSTVLLYGETGTGKEVLARFIHESSPRRQKPFVAVNCAALPEALLESELFGHERGAFTGAVRQRSGRFEDADGGTLFLDEIAETSSGVQAKLLRALEERRFERLGSNRSIPVDVRVIAATKRDLEVEVGAGRFRDDLYYRLKVVPILLPPLRERDGDVALLAQAFARRFGMERGRTLTFSPEALEALAHHPFPGNVRELHHLVQRLAVVCPAETVLLGHLPDEYAARGCPRVTVDPTSFEGTLSEMAEQFEKLVLARALTRFGGHRERTAEALGISRKNLWEKLKALGLEG